MGMGGGEKKSPPYVPDFLYGFRVDLNAFSKKHWVHSRPHLWHGGVQK